jgi:hypothetical protein
MLIYKRNIASIHIFEKVHPLMLRTVKSLVALLKHRIDGERWKGPKEQRPSSQ